MNQNKIITKYKTKSRNDKKLNKHDTFSNTKVIPFG